LQSAVLPKKKAFFPIFAECARLQNIALLFSIEFRQVDESTYFISTSDGVSASQLFLKSETARRKLLAEICSKVAPWVHFHTGASCKSSLLGQTDPRLIRLALIYALERKNFSINGTV